MLEFYKNAQFTVKLIIIFLENFSQTNKGIKKKQSLKRNRILVLASM